VTDSARPIHLILDTSAILAYTRGSIHVGEPVAEVDDEDAAVGLPIQCLAEAGWMVGDRDRLSLLVNHRATELINSSEDWSAFGEALNIVGRHDAASALRLAIELDCDVLTAQPRLYGGMAGGGPVIPIAR
jgi:hypothetical protein